MYPETASTTPGIWRKAASTPQKQPAAKVAFWVFIRFQNARRAEPDASGGRGQGDEDGRAGRVERGIGLRRCVHPIVDHEREDDRPSAGVAQKAGEQPRVIR